MPAKREFNLDKLCEILCGTSSYINNWLSKQPEAKEESLTDWLLFDLAEKTPNIFSHAFNRHEEARETGADWEWWFVYDDGAWKFRVQAKKLFNHKDNYPEIARTNKHGLQADLLLSSSKSNNAIPFYAFYSSGHEKTMCGGKCENKDGVYLAGASKIYNQVIVPGKKKIQPADVLSMSNPFSCIACCPLSMHENSLIGYLRHYYQDELDADTPSNVRDEASPLGFHKSLPGPIASFLEHAREKLPDWWEKNLDTHLLM